MAKEVLKETAIKLATKDMITAGDYDAMTRSEFISNLHNAGCDDSFITTLVHLIDVAYAMGKKNS